MYYQISLIVCDLFGGYFYHDFKVSNKEELEKLLLFCISNLNLKIRYIKELKD